MASDKHDWQLLSHKKSYKLHHIILITVRAQNVSSSTAKQRYTAKNVIIIITLAKEVT